MRIDPEGPIVDLGRRSAKVFRSVANGNDKTTSSDFGAIVLGVGVPCMVGQSRYRAAAAAMVEAVVWTSLHVGTSTLPTDGST